MRYVWGKGVYRFIERSRIASGSYLVIKQMWTATYEPCRKRHYQKINRCIVSYFFRLYFAFGELRLYCTRSCSGLFRCARVQPLRAVAALLLAGAPRRRPCPIAGPIRRAALPVASSVEYGGGGGEFARDQWCPLFLYASVPLSHPRCIPAIRASF